MKAADNHAGPPRRLAGPAESRREAPG